VLILLFCIFLLMPLFRPGSEAAGIDPEAAARDERLRQLEQEVEQLRRDLADQPKPLREEVEKLRKEKLILLQERLNIRVLQIDANTGALFYTDPERIEIRTQADALELVNRDRRRLGGHREVYYLILYPRETTSPFPHRGQRERYDQWFAEVPHGWDVPGSGPAKGAKQ
jgi:hypothetical protein